ncbi:MAG: Fic family protein [Alphaproteobacteria bacterium]|nr:Fic family protein [Alphaproteobacteria bacterium]
MNDPYCCPGTRILINHLNIRDKAELAATERAIAAKAILSLRRSPVHGAFDFDHLKEIHRRIFAKVYPFAGNQRTINMTKAEEKLAGASVEYAPFHLIKIRAEYHLTDLNSRDWSALKDMPEAADMESFARRIIYIWQVHPFREGNTRTTMTFMHQFAEANAFTLDRRLIRTHSDYVRHALVVGTRGEVHYLSRILVDARQRQRATEEASTRTRKEPRR